MNPDTVRKARMLAAKRSTSLSELLEQQIEELVGSDDAYQRAKRSALKRLEHGFHLGGAAATREELHER